MATFAEHNFGNDGAMEYLAVTAKLVATITEIMADPNAWSWTRTAKACSCPASRFWLCCASAQPMPPKPARCGSGTKISVYDRGIDEVTSMPFQARAKSSSRLFAGWRACPSTVLGSEATGP